MSEIILNSDAYRHNISSIAAKIGGVEKIFLVLKDNAYGHGISLIAPFAANLGIKRAVVKSQNEAEKIEKYFDEILILSHIPSGFESEKFIYTINDLSYFSRLKKGTKVHLAVDTAMRRNGVMLNEINDAMRLAKEFGIQICGAFTHFRSADEISSEFYVQNDNFETAKTILLQNAHKFGFSDLKFHAQNSAAIERSHTFKNDFVRVGIAQHGYSQFDDSLKLRRVLSLFADKVSSRTIKKGERVGYNGAFTAHEEMKIATYDLGYGDGLFRFNGVGELNLANGNPILGKISMDSFSSIDAGDRVLVIDDAQIWARFFDTISYEILVKLSPEIPRKLL